MPDWKAEFFNTEREYARENPLLWVIAPCYSWDFNPDTDSTAHFASTVFITGSVRKISPSPERALEAHWSAPTVPFSVTYIQEKPFLSLGGRAWIFCEEWDVGVEHFKQWYILYPLELSI